MNLGAIYCDSTAGTSHYFVLVPDGEYLRRWWFTETEKPSGLRNLKSWWEKELKAHEYTTLGWGIEDLEAFKLYLEL